VNLWAEMELRNYSLNTKFCFTNFGRVSGLEWIEIVRKYVYMYVLDVGGNMFSVNRL
jgi:hypothetical protein